MKQWILICALYLVGYFVAARRLYVLFDDQEPDKSNELWAAFCALLWPIWIITLAAKATLFRETPRQAATRLADELKVTARLAGEHGLSMPGLEVRPVPTSNLEVRPDDCYGCFIADARRRNVPPHHQWPATGALARRYFEESRARCIEHERGGNR